MNESSMNLRITWPGDFKEFQLVSFMFRSVALRWLSRD